MYPFLSLDFIDKSQVLWLLLAHVKSAFFISDFRSVDRQQMGGKYIQSSPLSMFLNILSQSTKKGGPPTLEGQWRKLKATDLRL